MTFTVRVDAVRWREHLRTVRDSVAATVDPAGALVPVAKGNGYGLGIPTLVREAGSLGLPAVAVGTVFELPGAAAETGFDGDLVVLAPFDPRDEVAGAAWATVASAPWSRRVIRTLSSTEGVAAAVAESATTGRRPRVVLEGLTSMNRFGLDESQIAAALADPATIASLDIEGLALHLPIAPPVTPRRPAAAMLHDVGTGMVERGSARAREVVAWGLLWTSWLADRLPDADVGVPATLWVSHLDDGELSRRAARPARPAAASPDRHPAVARRPAVPASRGHGAGRAPRIPAAGYRQRRLPRGGAVVVVGGGTSHGVALEAPSPAATLRQRAVAAGTGALEAVGRALSPFTWQGRQLWFAEPPHMHVSLLRIPAGVLPPEVGAQLDADVRYTVANPDRVLGLD